MIKENKFVASLTLFAVTTKYLFPLQFFFRFPSSYGDELIAHNIGVVMSFRISVISAALP